MNGWKWIIGYRLSVIGNSLLEIDPIIRNAMACALCLMPHKAALIPLYAPL